MELKKRVESLKVSTSGSVINDLAALFKRVSKQGLDLYCIDLLKQLLSLNDPCFGEKQANWVLKNSQAVLRLLDTKNGNATFRHTLKTLEEGAEQSVSRIIKKSKINRKFFYDYLKKITDLELFLVQDIEGYMNRKTIILSEDYKSIILALRVYNA